MMFGKGRVMTTIMSMKNHQQQKWKKGNFHWVLLTCWKTHRMISFKKLDTEPNQQNKLKVNESYNCDKCFGCHLFLDEETFIQFLKKVGKISSFYLLFCFPWSERKFLFSQRNVYLDDQPLAVSCENISQW
jgi:hypothetical protein